ncbi:hypothetical protein I4U23_004771 [Adineta vaga]|nr:hypothetical protein I4U23_004771 [Adineta vaga]
MIRNQTENRLNLTCHYDDFNATNCEYCVYQYFNNSTNATILRDCIQVTSTYKSFSDGIDIGYGVCSPLPYETCRSSVHNENE